MYNKKNLASLIAVLNKAVVNKKSSVIFFKFKGVISFLNALEKEGFILGYAFVKNKKIHKNVIIRIFLRYNLKTSRSPIFNLYNVNYLEAQSKFKVKSRFNFNLNIIEYYWTNQGFLTKKEAIRRHIGGIPICYVIG